MVKKCVNVLLDMVFGILSIVPPSPTLIHNVFQKKNGHECKEKIILLTKVIGVPTPCYDCLWDNLKSGYQVDQKF
jgi:hypothetical protein